MKLREIPKKKPSGLTLRDASNVYLFSDKVFNNPDDEVRSSKIREVSINVALKLRFPGKLTVGAVHSKKRVWSLARLNLRDLPTLDLGKQGPRSR